jgi:cytochrome c oxidase subunit 2
MSAALPQASNFAVPIDRMFDAMLLLCGSVALGVFVVMFWFCIKYRHGSRADREGRPNQRLGLELTWTLVPFLLFVGLFAWSIDLWTMLRTPPADATPIYVVAKQWMWKVQHASGRREIDMLHVPIGVPVRLVMTSQDVIHSFYIPAFRIKQDVVPGRYTALWFTATRLGSYPLLCSEYCGTDHAAMLGAVKVMSREDYQRWLHESAALAPAQQGRRLFVQFGCSGCHDPGAGIRAPDLHGLYASRVRLADGTSVTADDEYLHNAIMLPATQVVAGYASIMPAYQSRIDEEDVLALVAYIKSLRGQVGVGQQGVAHAQK